MRLRSAVMILALSTITFAQVTPVPKTTDPVLSESNSTSPDLLNRILALIADIGTDSELPAEMAGALGFNAGGQPWSFRQIAARADESDSSTPLHILAISRGTDQDVLLYVWGDGVSHFIRSHRDGRVVRAIAVDGTTEKAIPTAPADAQSEVNAEMQFWDLNAEKTAHWWRCMGELAGAHPVVPEKKIEGCTWVIQSGKETPRAVAMAYVNRSMAYRRDNQQKQMDDLNQAVRVDPTSASAWAELCGAQNWVIEDVQRAIQSCTKAIELNPHSPEGWTYRGDIRLRTKDYDLAIADYDHAIKLGPAWMWPWDNRGEAYLRENKIDRAIQDFNEVIRLNPDYAMGYEDRGIALMRKKDLDAALADFETGIKVDPKCAACFFGQGLVKRAKGDSAGGDADIIAAKALNPKVAEGFVEDGITVP